MCGDLMTIREKWVRVREEGQGGTVFVLVLVHWPSWSYMLLLFILSLFFLCLSYRSHYPPSLPLLFYFPSPSTSYIIREKYEYPRQWRKNSTQNG